MGKFEPRISRMARMGFGAARPCRPCFVAVTGETPVPPDFASVGADTE